jgi:hypothetical protein
MEPRLSYISPSLNEEALQHAIAYKLMFILGKDPHLPISMNGSTPRCSPFAIGW